MKRFKLISLVMALILVFVPMYSHAAVKEGIKYSALGDSIAFGYGGIDNNIGYVDLLKEHFEKVYGEVNFNDESFPGLKSFDVLTRLQSNPGAVQGADVITISIGGNDILQEIQEVDFGLLADPTDPRYLPYITALQEKLQARIGEFGSNFSSIIGTIRAINPTAKIYVNTIYNPFKPGDALYVFTDNVMRGLNGVIINGNNLLPEGYKYNVVDVYTQFSQYNNSNKPLTHIYDASPDIHPTDRGYKFIYNLHKDLMD